MTATNNNKRKHRRFWVCGILVLGLVLTALLTEPSSPSGRYVADPTIAIDGDFYWEFADGKVSLVYDGGRDDDFGTYANPKNGWVWTNDRGRTKPNHYIIKCSWFGLRFYDESGKMVYGMRRRLLPGRHPAWMPDWMQ